MSTTAIKSPSHSHSHSQSQSQSRSSRPATTPRGYPHSVGQANPPLLSPKGRSPQPTLKGTSPSYFGFVGGGDDSIPPDSNPGHHARQNWASSVQNTAHSSRTVSNESNPEFEAFRRQSETKGFNLNQSFSSLKRPSQPRTHSAATVSRSNVESPMSPHSKKPQLERSMKSVDSTGAGSIHLENKSFFDIPRQNSPGPMTPKHTVADHQHARLSLPANELNPSLLKMKKSQRSDTLPPTNGKESSSLVSPTMVVGLLEHATDILVLDLRVYQQYAAARIHGALNLCIPTTLLKRPSFTTAKLLDTFASDQDKEKFERWQECKYIVVHDANSSQAKEATTALNVLKKFTSEGWTGTGLVIKGGFLAFSRLAPQWIDNGPANSGKGASTQPLSITPPSQDVLPVAGGCSMPSAKSVANPFFGNIRQNMDLLDGVGQLSIKKPNMSEQLEQSIPSWLTQASKPSDEGKLVSTRFLSIEKSEQKRMQEALTANVCYGSPTSESPKQIQVAGIEKGSKNRYNNIFPYDHTRVRLQVSKDSCDYINASYVKAEYSNRNYIATQAPIPTTFNDFWRLAWEQDSRVVVMLTAEAEGGQVKSHTYWNSGDYGPLKLKKLSERQVSLEATNPSSQSSDSLRRPSMGQRRSTTNNIARERRSAENVASPTPEPSVVIVRTFTLSHSSFPFKPMREITQLQYTQWPDFGAPASPTAILGLIGQVNKYVRGSSSPSSSGPDEAAPKGQRPIIVHCSAGCGRTGTFCTIDSVIDMLKRQRLERGLVGDDIMDVDSHNNWVQRDDQDLVAKTVDDFRHQRLSMVQNLRQFVLCYESILQWVVSQLSGSRLGKDGLRRSYQG